MDELPLRILGAPGSPYSRKLRAVLRYRRIPHRWAIRGTPSEGKVPAIPVQLVPILVFPGPEGRYEEAAVDSTPLIRRLEKDYEGRSVVPPDPALAFLDALLEDYADEWLTKCMFHYRWVYPEDIALAGEVLARWRGVDRSDEQIAPVAKAFRERQIGRLGVVGSNAITAPVIEESYRRLLALLDRRLCESPFVLGRRPASCDFALFGQLTQLAQFDPTPMAIARAEAPRVVAWLDLVEDLSGLEIGEDGWISAREVPYRLQALFAEVGRVYAPFLRANAQALAAGSEVVRCEIAGRRWEQKAFPYQGKCLAVLRSAYEALPSPARATVDRVLAGTGCEELFA